jgi:alkanesulfonate monooxygenase SsuD/methylene tetrahydromethanopterin reductase-like flavin-dependent oxidoreductase (luciferase family)
VHFDIFCETEKAGPVGPDHEASVFRDTIEQARVADAAGFGCWWVVEHHGCPEFSYSSAPELMLAWIASQTERIRLGHSGVLAPFRINHPIRAAERAALLDHMSGGRVEFGLARSGGGEWDTFEVDAETTRDQLAEATRMIPQMWTRERFSWRSPLLTIPERNIVPKPLQKPHPPLWQTAGSPAAFHLAGTLGVGVLGNTLLTGFEQIELLLREYRRGLAECTEPAGLFVNDQAAIFTIVHVAESERAAVESGACLAALWYMARMPGVFRTPPENIYALIRGGLIPNEPTAIRSMDHGNTAREDGPAVEHPVVALIKRYAAGEAVSKQEAHELLAPIPTVIVGDPETCRRKAEAYVDLGAQRLMCFVQIADLPQQTILSCIRNVGKHLVPHFERKGSSR